jgi:hypothetical protein
MFLGNDDKMCPRRAVVLITLSSFHNKQKTCQLSTSKHLALAVWYGHGTSGAQTQEYLDRFDLSWANMHMSSPVQSLYLAIELYLAIIIA